jgi:hypothetical protein
LVKNVIKTGTSEVSILEAALSTSNEMPMRFGGLVGASVGCFSGILRPIAAKDSCCKMRNARNEHISHSVKYAILFLCGK